MKKYVNAALAALSARTRRPDGVYHWFLYRHY